jgi:hypothetical protein
MTALLELKEKMKSFYTKRAVYVNAAVRFLTALVVLLWIGTEVGGKGILANPVLKILAAAVCTFLPVNAILLVAAGFVLAGSLSVSVEFADVFLLLLVILLLLYFRFTPKYGFLVLLTPVAFILKVPYVVPIVMGLMAAPAAVIPMGIGVFLYQTLSFIGKSTASVSAEESLGISYLIQGIFQDQTTILLLVSFTATLAIVYLLRRLEVDHAWTIAIVGGAVCDFLILLMGKIFLSTSYGILPLILGTLGSVLLAFVIKFFAFHVDYSRVERVQFEDDEYYYYVKAVPKVSISGKNKKVTYINSRTEDFDQQAVSDIREKTRGIPKTELEEIDLGK